MANVGSGPPRIDIDATAASGAAFRIDEERPDATTVVLAIHGDADLHNASELNDRLGEAIDSGPTAVVVDLSGTTFLDSTTLGILLRAMKRLRAMGGSFRMVEPRAEIRRVFEMTLLDRVFELVGSRQEALSTPRYGGPRTGNLRRA
jgi:anti-sigma B factor antagonist